MQDIVEKRDEINGIHSRSSESTSVQSQMTPIAGGMYRQKDGAFRQIQVIGVHCEKIPTASLYFTQSPLQRPSFLSLSLSCRALELSTHGRCYRCSIPQPNNFTPRSFGRIIMGNGWGHISLARGKRSSLEHEQSTGYHCPRYNQLTTVSSLPVLPTLCQTKIPAMFFLR